ncbi:cytochrome P450 [Archangium gephyra]|uniref:Cytochrome P450 n=1 Tax=Archangium gephyra TaxID=48 RepID=A0AAC8TD71_9BACT|nr:cytochrome P450 [Archangium gephyra]AKJ00166.1 putative cytochrome P450 hydroxylase [Archangium gephyra]REG33136.1 cytochrome P450 [Archangium gephyra]
MTGRPNLMTPELKANPFPLYAELRRNAPVSQVDPGGMWAVTRYDDAMAVLKNPRTFSSAGFGLATNPPWLGGNPVSQSMGALDPPQHGRLRTLVNRAFTPTAVARMEPRVRDFVARVATALPLGRPVDMVPAFALPVPAYVLGELLGLDPSLHSQLKRWADQLTSVTAIRAEETERQEPVRQAVAEVRRYFSEVVELRRQRPGEDLVSDLLRARVDGEALTQDELLAFMFLLLLGGLETTVHLMGLCVLALMEHPEVMERLRADRSLVPNFVEEVLRTGAPGHGLLRLTTEEVELGGVRLPKGARVVVLLGSVCRDESQFKDGERFDLDRPGSQLPFGHGPHYCIGAALARLEAKLATEALLERCGGISPGEGPVVWHRSMVVRGPSSIPAVLHPA